MSQWESQIRTNLDDKVYIECLDSLLRTAPGMLDAALINTRYSEGCVRFPEKRGTSDEVVANTIELTRGLFAPSDGNPTDQLQQQFDQIKPFKSAYIELDSEKVFLQRLDNNSRVLMIVVSSALNMGAAQTQLLRANAVVNKMNGGGLQSTLEAMGDILAATIVDVESGELIDHYRRYDDPSNLNLQQDVADVAQSLFTAQGQARELFFEDRDGNKSPFMRMQLSGANRSYFWARLAFDNEHILMVTADNQAIQGLVWIAINNGLNNVVRIWVDGLLEYGVESTMEPFPETQNEFLKIVDDLGDLEKNDLLSRLNIGGFANYTVGKGEDMQRCQECIYYLPHSKWCDLPELPIPVEAHWWCRLWKA